MVGVLWAVFILSYFDRYILGLLVDPIKQSLKLSDFQMGLLLGPAFSLFNVACGMPLGWFADRNNRKWLLFAGIVIWCSMTVGSAFATAFLPLFLLRLGLGLGEAVVLPASMSIISDYFDRKQRGRAISIYLSAIYIGAGLAFFIGGNIVGWLQRSPGIEWFGLGRFEPWQLAFLIVGLPGFLLALMMTTVREPARVEQRETAEANGIMQYVLKRWRGFGVLFVASSCNLTLTTLTLWNVPLFTRVWGWGVAASGTATGLLYFTAGPLATLVSILLLKRLVERFPHDGTMRLLLIGLMIGVPASALYPMMPTPELGVAMMAVAFVGKGIATVAGPAALTMILPGDLRSRGVALYSAAITLVGTLIGPPLIGLAVDVMGDPKSLNVVLSAYVLTIGIPSITIAALGLRHFRSTLVELEDELQSTGGNRHVSPQTSPTSRSHCS